MLSMPPMINSEETKLSENTRNVFIDVTGLDLSKIKIVLTTIYSMFSMYCEEPFTIESVKHISEDGSTFDFPDLTPTVIKTNLNYLNNLAGINVKLDDVKLLLTKFGMETEIHNEQEATVIVPVSRTDILHACDIAEDLAIAYGYNKIVKLKPKTVCFGYQQPINKLSDLVRSEMAEKGYVECLTFTLLSKKDQFTNMCQEINDKEVVGLYKPKTHEFEIFRKNLIPGLLKTIESNITEHVIFYFIIYELSLDAFQSFRDF